jgi:hypothetical protein
MEEDEVCETKNDSLNNFEEFADSEIKSAIIELGKIKKEENRKHLQRLVYVELVNRFDSLVDDFLLDFSIKNSGFKNKVLNEIKTDPVFLKDIYEIFLSNNPQSLVAEKVKAVVSLRFLNQRHSKKLYILLRDCFEWEDTDLQRPRVNINNGKVFENFKSKEKHKKIPPSIIGYADWLYSRRNTSVHSNKSELLERDYRYIKKSFNVEPSRKTILKLNSINSALTFYKFIVSSLKK